MKFSISLLVIITIVVSNISLSQNKGLYMPRNVQRAIDKKTRTLDGRMGINYWQNRADYKIDVELNPETRLVKGKEKIIYFNNSPDTLHEILVHLFPNFFQKGNPRDFAINPEDESNGVVIDEISYNGKRIDNGANSNFIEYRGTNLKLILPIPIPSKSRSEFLFNWNYILNKESDRVFRHYMGAINMLRLMKQSPIKITVNAQTAVVGQNQMVQANNYE